MSRINSEGEYGSRESSETLARALSLLLPNSLSPITSSLSYLCTAASQASSSVCCGLCPLRWMRERKKAARTLHAVLPRWRHWLLCTRFCKGLPPAENAGARCSTSPPTTTASPHHRSRAALRRCSSICCSSSEPRLLLDYTVAAHQLHSPLPGAGRRAAPQPRCAPSDDGAEPHDRRNHATPRA